MTNQDFTNLQKALGLSGTELAEKLGVHPSAVSKWRIDREIPDYIAKAMESLLQSVEITLPLDVLVNLARHAESQGLSFGQYLTASLKSAAAGEVPPPANVIRYVINPDAEPAGQSMIADNPDPDA